MDIELDVYRRKHDEKWITCTMHIEITVKTLQNNGTNISHKSNHDGYNTVTLLNWGLNATTTYDSWHSSCHLSMNLQHTVRQSLGKQQSNLFSLPITLKRTFLALIPLPFIQPVKADGPQLSIDQLAVFFSCFSVCLSTSLRTLSLFLL